MYYIVIDNEQKGPFPAEELMAKGATAESLVWKEGMGDWTPLSQVGELQALLPKATPPPPPPPPVTPPPVTPSPPPHGPTVSASTAQTNAGDGLDLETKQAVDEGSILDSELSQAAKDTFTNMDLSTDDVLDFKSSTFSANRGTIYALVAIVTYFLSAFVNTDYVFGFGGFLKSLFFSVLPTMAMGMTFMEMSKLLLANGGRVGSSHFRNGSIAYLATAGVLLLAGLISIGSNPLSYVGTGGPLIILGLLAGLAGLAALVFIVMAGIKVMKYEAKFFKELGYAIIGGLIGAFVLSLLAGAMITTSIGLDGSFEIGGGAGYTLLQLLVAICFIAPMAVIILIFQRAGKNGGKVV
ncbi:MAG: DUF4339 domain-containing protein [Bacteroidota bacterium]